MLKKRLKKIAKISVLIGLRQTWGWLCNLYLLSYQPFLTIKNLADKRDKSQIFLLGVTVLIPIGFYGVMRIVWDKMMYGVVLRSVGPVFLATVLVEIIIFSFFAYWIYQVMRRR
jgi:hypothetical protein